MKLFSFDRVVSLILLCCGVGILFLWIWEQTQQLPDFSSQTVVFMSTDEESAGRLAAFDPNTESITFLSPSSLIVNQFSLVRTPQEDTVIFYTAIRKRQWSGLRSIYKTQQLYSLHINTGKTRRIAVPYGVQLQTLYPWTANDMIFFEAQSDHARSVWTYSFRRKTWKSLYEEFPLQNIAVSESSQLLVGANPFENFGFSLFPLQEDPDNIQPVGNYFQNFGFSSDGRHLLLKQKPDQDVFSPVSYIVIFSADGTATSVLQDIGEIIYATWSDDDNRLLAVIRDDSFQYHLFEWHRESETATRLYSFEDQTVSWMNVDGDFVWFVLESEKITDEFSGDYEDLQELLDVFATSEKIYTIVRYNQLTQKMETLPFSGLLPQSFSSLDKK